MRAESSYLPEADDHSQDLYDWGAMARDPEGQKLLRATFVSILTDFEDPDVEGTADKIITAFKTR